MCKHVFVHDEYDKPVDSNACIVRVIENGSREGI